MKQEKLVFTAAVMDLCHEGHINLLKKMRKEAGKGKVIVVLHDDKSIYDTKGRIPIQDLEHRMENVRITELVDEVLSTTDYQDLARVFEKIISSHTLYNLVFMRGNDWSDFPASKTIKEHNIPIKFVEYTKGVSSTLIRKELKNVVIH